MIKQAFFFVSMIVAAAIAVSAQTGKVVFSKSPKTPEAVAEVKSGEFLYAHVQFSKPLAGILTITDKPVTLTAEFYLKGKLLDDEMFGFDTARVKASKATAIVLPVVSEAAVDVNSFGKNLFSVRLPASLAALPEGRHEIEMKITSFNFKDGAEPLAAGNFVLVVEAGARAWYQQNSKDVMAAFSKRGITSVDVSERDAAMGVVGGKDVITLVNNCGRSVWMRKATGSDKREYRLAPGQTMLYDRDGSALEEWNFGTQKWNLVTRAFSADTGGKANICGK